MSRRFLLNHLLTESARRTPDAVAVRCEEDALDYRALEELSNGVANLLRSEGVAPGDRVGLHVKKSIDAIIVLFGILKAGACVVPIGPGTPAPRFLDIARQCEMRTLVASRDTCSRLGAETFEQSGLDLVLLTGTSSEVVPEVTVRQLPLAAAKTDGDSGPPVPTVDRDLAYVLFTSGSTGSPKGVMLSHQAVLNFVKWASEEFAIGPGDRLSNHAPLNFDISTFDIYAAIGAGASVTLIPESLAMFPHRLAQLIEEARITVWYSVPSVLTLLVTRGDLASRDLSPLRAVLFAGEVFPSKHLRELMLAVPRPRYFNLYGPTETNVCTFYEVTGPPAPDAPPIPIGRACPNTKTLVLGGDGRPVTRPGEEGVLYVGGSSVMDGYYGRPEETEAAFVLNPLAHGREERLYCTGDWVSVDDGGDYLFLGRRDHMVKVGGHRVELGEIEAALYSHPGIREAAAVPLPDEMLGRRIRAVVVTADPGPSETDLLRHCRALLPQYMVPQDIVFTDALPRTATDKVDRPQLVKDSMGGREPG